MHLCPPPNPQVHTDYDHCLQHTGASMTRGSSPIKDIDYLTSLACFPSVSADKYRNRNSISHTYFSAIFWQFTNHCSSCHSKLRLLQSEILKMTLSQLPKSFKSVEDMQLNTLRTGLLNCLNARSRGLTFRHRASCV